MNNMTVRLDSFSGPLDLLYHLIEKNEIDIYDIPIAELTEQYMEFISREENKNMDGMSEFIVMAADLIEIKSRMLLPKVQSEEPEEDPRDELVQKLLEYKKFKGVTETFQRMEENASKTKEEVLVTFLALLELIRHHSVLVEQEQVFGEIMIYAGDNLDGDESGEEYENE